MREKGVTIAHEAKAILNGSALTSQYCFNAHGNEMANEMAKADGELVGYNERLYWQGAIATMEKL